MTHYRDGTEYEFLDNVESGTAQNIGWLDAAGVYTTGKVSEEFIARLSVLCSRGVYRTRGYHTCNLCPRREHDKWPSPTVVCGPDGEYAVGSSEIRVVGIDGERYAAPDMVIHYVVDHGYRPPDRFIDAVLTTAHAGDGGLS